MSRATKREVISQRIKMVNRLERELDKIHNAQNQLGYLELDKPIRDGWIKTMKLREDVLRSKKSNVYKEVLKSVLKEIWGREKKYADKKWKEFFNEHHRNFQRPGIRRLNSKEFSKLSTKAQRCFVKRKRKTCRGYKNIYCCILPRYYFVVTYRRAYITKRKIISPILESREQEIMELLAKPTLYPYSVYCNYNFRFYYNPNKADRRRSKMILASRKFS